MKSLEMGLYRYSVAYRIIFFRIKYILFFSLLCVLGINYKTLSSNVIFMISSPKRNKQIQWLMFFQTLAFLVTLYDSGGEMEKIEYNS